MNENNRTPPTQEPLYSQKFLSELGDRPRRLEDMPIDAYYKDIAKSAQEHLEKASLHLLEYLHEKTNSQNLCLAGGVALNVLINQKLMEPEIFFSFYSTAI